MLIDGDSASASEIFAGAIRDNRRGTVMGQRSYGKGSVQGIFPLTSSKAGIRLTTAKFYSPKGQAISQRGVQPDIPIQVAAKPAVADPAAAGDEQFVSTGADVDRVLDSATRFAREQLTRRAPPRAAAGR